jgi:hypothetical protein
MTWILLALLVYVLFGAFLVARSMRGMHVSAGMDEWIALIFLWPLMLRFFVHLAVLQARIQELENWANEERWKR